MRSLAKLRYKRARIEQAVPRPSSAKLRAAHGVKISGIIRIQYFYLKFLREVREINFLEDFKVVKLSLCAIFMALNFVHW